MALEMVEAGLGWGNFPQSVVAPSFWWLLGIMALFSWLALVDVVRDYLTVPIVG